MYAGKVVGYSCFLQRIEKVEPKIIFDKNDECRFDKLNDILTIFGCVEWQIYFNAVFGVDVNVFIARWRKEAEYKF